MTIWRQISRAMRRLSPLQADIRRGDLARDQGRKADAVVHYRAALTRVPDRTDVRVQLANMLKDLGQFDEAEVDYRRALQEQPANADTHLQLGHLLKISGRRGQALSAYEQALEIDPTLRAARRELADAGVAFHQIALYQEAKLAGEEVTVFPVEAYGDMRRLFPLSPPSKKADGLSIAIVLLADSKTSTALDVQVDAIRRQSHSAWALYIVGDDLGPGSLNAAAAGDARIAWVEPNKPPRAAQELKVAGERAGDLVLLLAPAAVLQDHALAWIAATAAHTLCDAVFMDEEVVEDGALAGLTPVFRSTADKDSILEANLYGETLALTREALKRFQPETFDSASTARAAMLTALIAEGRVAHIPLPLVRTPAEKATVESSGKSSGKSSISPPPAPGATPAIAVIIPTKNNSSDACAMVDSLISLARSASSLEIVVLNNSGLPFAADPLLAALAERPTVKIYDIPDAFNWSSFNNLGASLTRAPNLLFANDDMLMLTQDWDDQVLQELARPEIGALGARLIYPDGALQHAGILFRWRGQTIHDGLHRALDDQGPNRRWGVKRAVSAVTGAFLATRRSDFEKLGGFDETNLAISYNDVDYALKLRSSGLRILWTPRITLDHYESKTRGLDHWDPAKVERDRREAALIHARWPGILDIEPSLNPSWSQSSLPFRLISPPTEAALWRYIERSAFADPWRVDAPTR